MQSTKTKKPNFKRVFWYLFGIIQMISGAANLIEKEEFYWTFTLQFTFGLVIVILNVLGKIETGKL